MCVYFERGIRVAMFVSVTAKHRRLKLCVCGEGWGGCPIDGSAVQLLSHQGQTS